MTKPVYKATFSWAKLSDDSNPAHLVALSHSSIEIKFKLSASNYRYQLIIILSFYEDSVTCQNYYYQSNFSAYSRRHWCCWCYRCARCARWVWRYRRTWWQRHMIKNNIHIIIWWCCQSIHCKEKTSYDYGVQNLPENSSKNVYLLCHENKVEFLQGQFRNKSFPFLSFFTSAF